ncbi:hypothetical protein GKD60_24430 [Parabacteroides distasonis]|nr:hypothetical protein [Parabacteroides distasonis]
MLQILYLQPICHRYLQRSNYLSTSALHAFGCRWQMFLCFSRFFVKFGGNLFFISTVFLFFFLNPIKSCRYVCFLVTLKTPHH